MQLRINCPRCGRFMRKMSPTEAMSDGGVDADYQGGPIYICDNCKQQLRLSGIPISFRVTRTPTKDVNKIAYIASRTYNSEEE